MNRVWAVLPRLGMMLLATLAVLPANVLAQAAIREKFKGAVAQGNMDAAREAYEIVMEQEKKAEAHHA